MLPVQMKMARAALGLGIKETASLAKVSHDTVTRLQAGETLKCSTINKIRNAFENAGVIFVEAGGEGPGVRLRKQGS